MNTGSKKIAFCTISDNSYYEPCSVMIYSFLKNNNWYDGDIIVFYDDLTEENKSKIVLSLFARTEGLRFGLFNGLYLILEPSSIMIRESNLSYSFAYFFTAL